MALGPQYRLAIISAIASIALLVGGILAALLGAAVFPLPCCDHIDPWWLLFRGSVGVSLIVGTVSLGVNAKSFRHAENTWPRSCYLGIALATSVTLTTALMLFFRPAVENAYVIWVMTRPPHTTGIVGNVSFPEGPTQSYPFVEGGGVSSSGISMGNGCFSLIKHSATNFGIYMPGYPTLRKPINSGYFYALVKFGAVTSPAEVEVKRVSLLRYAWDTIACNRSDPVNSTEVGLWSAIRHAKPLVDLAEAGPANWDRVCVIAPYSNSALAGNVVGFPWDMEKQYPDIPTNEGAQVLAFVSGQRVVASSEHPRARGDFASLEGQCLTRAESKLVARKDDQGRLLLERPDQEHSKD